MVEVFGLHARVHGCPCDNCKGPGFESALLGVLFKIVKLHKPLGKGFVKI